MKDRVPEPGKENRFKFTLDDGTILTGVLSFADEATQAGSAYTKGNVLPDEVCDLLGISRTSSEPKDAFSALGNRNVAGGAYASDFYLYMTGKHPILNAGAYSDYTRYAALEITEQREIKLSGNSETIIVYDGYGAREEI